MPSGSVFRVLFVCTGNICRSPLAERLLRHELTRRLGAASTEPIEVGSVGVSALVGEPMDRGALAALTHLGGDGAGFAARQLEADLLARADLVLVATRRHRAAVVRMEPRAAARTFTIREFGRLAAHVDATHLPDSGPIERLLAAVAEAAALRGTIVTEGPEGDDVRDPYGGPAEGHAEAARTISAALAPTADLVTVAVSQAAPRADGPAREPGDLSA